MSKEKRYYFDDYDYIVDRQKIGKEEDVTICAFDDWNGIVDFMNKQDQQIADLEVKLAESEKNVEFYKERYSDATTSAYGADLMAKDYQWHLEKEIAQLKQQLAEKDTKLHEYIRCALEDYNDNTEEIKQLKQQLEEKDAELIGRKKLCDLRYKQLQDAHKDKIEFAIAELEKVKDTIDKSGYKILEALWVNFVVIDKQIEQLNASNSMPLEEESE